MKSPESSAKSLDRVVPRIYVAIPDAGAADITLSEADSPVERRLVADLLVFYAFDAGSHYEIVSNRDLDGLGITSDHPKKAILKWGIVWHRDRRTENADLSPHIYFGKKLVPETLHQLRR